jgi:hypothetical protein
VWSLKLERWGSPLVQEKYQEEKACDKRHPCHIIITISSSSFSSSWMWCLLFQFQNSTSVLIDSSCDSSSVWARAVR